MVIGRVIFPVGQVVPLAPACVPVAKSHDVSRGSFSHMTCDVATMFSPREPEIDIMHWIQLNNDLQ